MRRGNFTWHDGMQRWVWPTFNNFQWDLNYSNPAVFRAMLEEMFFIASTGVRHPAFQCRGIHLEK